MANLPVRPAEHRRKGRDLCDKMKNVLLPATGFGQVDLNFQRAAARPLHQPNWKGAYIQ